MAEWIKVSDRLPEEKEWVLGFEKDGKYIACNFKKTDSYGIGYFLDYDNVVRLGITHWCYLPQPPEAE